MRPHRRMVGLLWRWHRRLGLLAALFVLVLASSGIVLNHASELGLDRSLVDSPLLRRAYGDASDKLPGYKVESAWLSRAANGKVYLNAIEVAPCRGELVGALSADGLLYAGCTGELLLISPAGELIESFTSSTGLPVPLAGLGLADNDVVLQSGANWWLADLDQVDFGSLAAAGSFIQQLAPGPLPEDIRAAIPAQEQWLSWERVLLDLHSGRLAGLAGVLAMDLAGVLLCCLALSGIAMWWLHRRRRRRTTQT